MLNRFNIMSETVKWKVVTSKSSLRGIGWNDEHRPALEEFILKVNQLTKHTYAFIKHIFLCELAENESFSLAENVNCDFFVEVFLSLIKKQRTSGRKPHARTLASRELIAKHRTDYLNKPSFPLNSSPTLNKLLCMNAKIIDSIHRESET